MKRVLCIAESCCDIIFGALPRIPKPGEEIYCGHFEVKAGGGANTPMVLGRIGVPVRFLTGVGDDFFGEMVKRALQGSRVELADTGVRAGSATPVSAVLSTKEDRSFVSYGGSGGDFMTEKRLEEEIRQADIVHTYLGYCLHYPISRLCAAYGKKLSLDTSCADADSIGEAKEILRACHFLKVNEDEALKLTKEYNPWRAAEALAAFGIEHVIVTMGAKGSIALCSGRRYEQPVIRMGACVDACGAGDSFAAGILAGAAAGAPMADMLKLGAVLSGMCVTWYGGVSDTLDADTVRKRFHKN